MTYRKDSDFPMTYGFIEKIQNHPPEGSDAFNDLVKSFGEKNAERIVGKKRDRAAWLVSNCETISKRENYVKVLQQHFDVCNNEL